MMNGSDLFALISSEIYSSASIFVLLHLFDSPVNSIAKIHAGGVASDWDYRFPIR
jgi:hypothetical protein